MATVYPRLCVLWPGFLNARNFCGPTDAGSGFRHGDLKGRKVRMKGFKVVNYISFSFPKLAWRNCIIFGRFAEGRKRGGRFPRCLLRRQAKLGG